MMPEMMLAAAAPSELLAQVATVIVAFFITLAILVKLAWSPILAAIDERRKTISDEFESITQRQAELDSKMKDYEERLRQIDREAQERLNKAVDEGKRLATELVEQAQNEAASLKEKATADITVEIEKARVQLRDEVVTMTIQATERLLRAELNDEKHRKLVVEFISDLEQRKAS